MPRAARLALALAFVPGAAVAVAACGSSPMLGSAQVEHEIQRAIKRHSGIPTTVTCPSEIKDQVGLHFTCVVHLEAGAYPVAVTVTNKNGEFRYVNHEPFVALNTAKVQGAIVASIAKQRGLGSTVQCPRYVLQRKGVSFTCVATVKGKKYPFSVTQTNDRGHVTYEGH